MTRHFNDPEARAEWSERFGEPQQQGFHETYMRPQPCAYPERQASSVERMVDHLHDTIQFFDESGNQANDIVCAEIGLRLRQYFNAETSGPVAEDPDADLLESLTYWPQPEQNDERTSQ